MSEAKRCALASCGKPLVRRAGEHKWNWDHRTHCNKSCAIADRLYGVVRCGHDSSLRDRDESGKARCVGCAREARNRWLEKRNAPLCMKGDENICNRPGCRFVAAGAREMYRHKQQHSGAISSERSFWRASAGLL